jgi:hypothetical protein
MLRHELSPGLPAPGRMGRILLAALALGLGLAGLRALGAPLAVLLVAAALAYPALLFALRALELGEVRVLLRDRAIADQ